MHPRNIDCEGLALADQADSLVFSWLVPSMFQFTLTMLVLILGVMIYKYYRNKPIWCYYKETPRNKKLMSVLEPLIEQYSPTFYLPFSLMKMLLTNDKKLAVNDVYMRMNVKVADGEVFSLDWYPRKYRNMDPKTPIVFYVPGVFGISKDKYAYHFCKIAHKELGWRTFVFHRRLLLNEPTGSHVNSYLGYSDWKEIVDHIKSQFPEADIYMVGVSMGALNIQRYLIETGKECGVKAAVTISSPFSARGVSDAVRKSKLFLKHMLAAQHRMIKQHMHSEKFVELLERKGIDVERVLATTDNADFDELFALPDMGFKTRDEYYNSLSSDKLIGDITVPVLSINSMDDLLIPTSCVPLEKIQQNPNIIQLMVAGGGHIEYFSGLNRRYWAYSTAIEYLRIISEVTNKYSQKNPGTPTASSGSSGFKSAVMQSKPQYIYAR